MFNLKETLKSIYPLCSFFQLIGPRTRRFLPQHAVVSQRQIFMKLTKTIVAARAVLVGDRTYLSKKSRV